MIRRTKPTRERQDFDPKLLDRFKPLSPSELEKLPPQEWRIEGWLLEDALVEIYAAPETGKTFLALDWGLSVAAGVPWLGHVTRSGKVLYVYTENPRGLRLRMAAWFAEHGEHLRPVVEKNFCAITVPVDLRDPLERSHFIRAQCEFQPDIIVIDTLNKCFGDGNESQTQDMTEFVAGCNELREWFTGATVLVLHHPGKDESRGDRGSTAFHCALDMQFHLTQKGDNSGKLTLKITKLRDGARSEPLALQLVAVGESCVIRAGGVVAATKGKAKPKPEDKALAVLARLGPEGATEREWREATGASRTTFDRHRDLLLGAERVTQGKDGRLCALQTAVEAAPALAPQFGPDAKQSLIKKPGVAPAAPQVLEVAPAPLTDAQLDALAKLLLLEDANRSGVPEDVWFDTAGKAAREIAGRRDLVEYDPVTKHYQSTSAAGDIGVEAIEKLVLGTLRDGMTKQEWIEEAGCDGGYLDQLRSEGLAFKNGGRYYSTREAAMWAA